MKSGSSFIVIAFLFMALTACNTSKILSSMNSIYNKTWKLTSLYGISTDTSIYTSGTPTINFSEDGKLNGSTGCNRFSGSYKIESAKLILDPGAMTRMFCPGDYENEFISALTSIDKLITKENELILLHGSKEVMRLKTSGK